VVRPGERIHVIGIAGSGAAGAALLAARAGAVVTGCDADGPSPYTPPLDAAGIAWQIGHDVGHLAGSDRVAITPALRANTDLPELLAAHAAALPVVPWQAILGELMAEPGRIGLAVAGTHGKSTTTALLGHLLIVAGLDPTVEVGAFIAAWGGNVRSGSGVPFVVEADEFGDNFAHYHPSAAIVTTVEMDHPDYFADRQAVLDSFEGFVRGMAPDPRLDGGRLLLAAAGDRGVDELLERLPGWEGRIVRYGAGEHAALDVAYAAAETSFTLFGSRFHTSLAGAHNVMNATAALILARELGAAVEALQAGLASFSGAGRRMELIADTAGVTVFDDYGHHPTEVRAALAAARQKVGERRLWAVFEPHMFSRTALFMDDFAESFGVADEVVIADIFASRDTDLSVASAERLADAIERTSGIPAVAGGDVEQTTHYVAERLRSGDAVLVMGAGKSYRIARGLADALQAGVIDRPRGVA
jgi:UDP-N-acetylmuramate--alanine ligase